MAIKFSTKWFLRFCLMGFQLGSSPNLWTITSAGTPSMPVGAHVKIAAFCRRNAISSSRNVSAIEPSIYTHLSSSSGFNGTRSVA
ncbi:hypothetical protein Nepgr_020298 [Nepenthes gracilis]|uniref:Secreted protein n=1 Tax=Nepenthes gracilis TaxID=150966 RepID=A0AAD3SWT3_NEPGR|nr:hypothetical protein Nepgr_020298 [Nepenthes gracilis]